MKGWKGWIGWLGWGSAGTAPVVPPAIVPAQDPYFATQFVAGPRKRKRLKEMMLLLG